jgi:DAACS family dicarboxylate/amino acid:cation (Na+ or H+) symporter
VILRRVGSLTRVPLVARLLAGIALGVVVGVVLKERAAILGEVGILVIKLLKALATPLVFFAVVDSFCRAKIPLRKGAVLLVICAVNATVAGAIAIGLSALIAPGSSTNAAALQSALGSGSGQAPAIKPKMDPLEALRDLIPESVPDPFVRNNVLAIVLLAIICGVALRSMLARGRGETLFKVVEEVFELLATVLHGVIAIVPVAVFGVVAKVIGTTGFGIFASLGALVGTVALGLFVHVFGYYATLVLVIARRSPLHFFRSAGSALMTALGTGSSMATLPVTLRTLEKDLRVSHDSARLAACVGTNFNNDGIMLYEVVAALFIAQINGIHLDLGQKVQLALTSALAAAGIAGVPEAGLITLSLVLSSVGLPLSSLPVLLTVDWLLGRLRAATNVSSDLLVATLLDRVPAEEAVSPSSASPPAPPGPNAA